MICAFDVAKKEVIEMENATNNYLTNKYLRFINAVANIYNLIEMKYKVKIKWNKNNKIYGSKARMNELFSK